MNVVTSIAERNGRDYITPEDVSAAFDAGNTAGTVRMAVLEVIGKQTRFGVEDAGLCAFIAWRGESTP